MIDIAEDYLKPLCKSHNIINYAANQVMFQICNNND